MAMGANQPFPVEKETFSHRRRMCTGCLRVASAAGSFRPKHPQTMLERNSGGFIVTGASRKESKAATATSTIYMVLH